jgi:hypothetical protein
MIIDETIQSAIDIARAHLAGGDSEPLRPGTTKKLAEALVKIGDAIAPRRDVTAEQRAREVLKRMGLVRITGTHEWDEPDRFSAGDVGELAQLIAEHDAIVPLAAEVGRHWRDQEGVSGPLLDRLAEVTARHTGKVPAFDLTTLVPSSRVRVGGYAFVVAALTFDPARGHFALEFTQCYPGGESDGVRPHRRYTAAERETMLAMAREEVPPKFAPPAGSWQDAQPRSMAEGRQLFSFLGKQYELIGSDGEQVTAGDTAAVRGFLRAQAAAVDAAVLEALGLGYAPDELRLTTQLVSGLGERTTMSVRGVEVWEIVVTPPSMPRRDESDAVTVRYTVTPRWLVDLKPAAQS